MKKAFIFDWNGTLTDDWVQIHESACAVFEHFGKTPLTMEEFCGGLCATGEYRNIYLNHGIDETRDALNAVFRKRYTELMDDVVLVDGARELLKALTRSGKHEVHLVTANLSDLVIPLLERFELLDFFTEYRFHVIDKSAVIKEIAAEVGMDESRSYYIGDSPSDIRHARSAKVSPVAFLNEYIPRENIVAERPWLAVTRLRDLHFLAD